MMAIYHPAHGEMRGRFSRQLYFYLGLSRPESADTALEMSSIVVL